MKRRQMQRRRLKMKRRLQQLCPPPPPPRCPLALPPAAPIIPDGTIIFFPIVIIGLFCTLCYVWHLYRCCSIKLEEAIAATRNENAAPAVAATQTHNEAPADAATQTENEAPITTVVPTPCCPTAPVGDRQSSVHEMLLRQIQNALDQHAATMEISQEQWRQFCKALTFELERAVQALQTASSLAASSGCTSYSSSCHFSASHSSASTRTSRVASDASTQTSRVDTDAASTQTSPVASDVDNKEQSAANNDLFHVGCGPLVLCVTYTKK